MNFIGAYMNICPLYQAGCLFWCSNLPNRCRNLQYRLYRYGFLSCRWYWWCRPSLGFLFGRRTTDDFNPLNVGDWYFVQTFLYTELCQIGTLTINKNCYLVASSKQNHSIGVDGLLDRFLMASSTEPFPLLYCLKYRMISCSDWMTILLFCTNVSPAIIIKPNKQ